MKHIIMWISWPCSLCLHYPPHVGDMISRSSGFSESGLVDRKLPLNCVLHSFVNYFEQYFLVCDIRAIVLQFSQSLASPFLNSGMKTDLFQSSGHSPVFHILLNSL